ncbi:sugar phosphate isomerase/epimerase [bacterium]|nr:MAG: sugar phosphate isomerase/epimerase [bacterium]
MSAARYAFSIPTDGPEEQTQLFGGFNAAGFAGLQLKGGQYARYLNEPQQFLDEWGNDKGTVAGLIYGGGLEAEGQANLRRVFDFAGAVGSEMVIFCHGRSRDSVSDDDIRGFARQLSALGAEALERGVKLSLHNHFDNPVMHRADFTTFFEAITPGTVGLTLDTAHLQKSGVFDIAGVVRDYGSFIDNMHLKDFADGQFKTLGRGEIDFSEIFAALHEIKFEGWLCADEESETGVAESLRASFDFIERRWNSHN